jgi:hypothetical protein
MPPELAAVDKLIISNDERQTGNKQRANKQTSKRANNKQANGQIAERAGPVGRTKGHGPNVPPVRLLVCWFGRS